MSEALPLRPITPTCRAAALTAVVIRSSWSLTLS